MHLSVFHCAFCVKFPFYENIYSQLLNIRCDALTAGATRRYMYTIHTHHIHQIIFLKLWSPPSTLLCVSVQTFKRAEIWIRKPKNILVATVFLNFYNNSHRILHKIAQTWLQMRKRMSFRQLDFILTKLFQILQSEVLVEKL
jgi:hypothetical protein